jgi:hypothetical protein
MTSALLFQRKTKSFIGMLIYHNHNTIDCGNASYSLILCQVLPDTLQDEFAVEMACGDLKRKLRVSEVGSGEFEAN